MAKDKKKKSKKPDNKKGSKSAKASSKGGSKVTPSSKTKTGSKVAPSSKTATSASSAASSAACSSAASGTSGTSSSKGTCSGSGTTTSNNSSCNSNNSSKANSKTSKKSSSAKDSSKKGAATTSKKMNFALSVTAESVCEVDPAIVEQNEEQLRMIIDLLETINVDYVTPHVKDDLDRIQKLVLNIAYREANVRKKVISVHFTELQRAVIKTVICGGEGASMPVNINYPFVKLKLVPTRQSMSGNTTKKK